MRRVRILVGILPMLLAAVVCANDYVVTQPLVIPQNTVLTVLATDHYIFSNTGKIVVSPGATLRFAGRDAHNNPTDVSLFSLGGTMPVGWPIIDLQTGGLVTGKHARFDGLPIALSGTDGKVTLDSVTFTGCDNAIYISSFVDTVALTNSTVSGGRLGISATANASSYSHYFYMYNCILELCSETGIELYKVHYGLIDHCKGQGVAAAIGIFLQEVSNVDILYYSGWDWGGNIEWLDSAPHLGHDSLAHGGSFAVCASGDYNGMFAHIDHCYIGHAGWNGGVGGFIAYANNSVLTCNSFDRNIPFQVYCTGNSAPSFYDAKNGKIGANYFVGLAGYPLVFMKDAYPYFLDGQNEFHLDDPTTSLYMQDASSAPKMHLLNKNYFANGTGMQYFSPSNPALWNLGGSSGPGTCGASIGNYQFDNGGKVLMGDAFLAAGQISAAQNKYSQALSQYGENTDGGAVALERLTTITTSVPTVNTTSMQTAKKYLLSYKYDASGNYDAADSIRTIILASGSTTDSIRVAYDKSVALALQSSDNKAAVANNPFTLHESVVARRALFNRIITKDPIPTQSTAKQVMPTAFNLLPVYPNPFNATTQIRFDISTPNHFRVAIYSTDGRLVRMLSDADYNAGSYRLEWNGRNDAGITVASGVYLVKLQSPNGVATKKAVLLK